jgi:hypothetical protein
MEFALQLRKEHGKTSVRVVQETSVRVAEEQIKQLSLCAIKIVVNVTTNFVPLYATGLQCQVPIQIRLAPQ